MKYPTLFTSFALLASAVTSHADILNKLTIVGTVSTASAAVVKQTTTTYSSTQKLVSAKITNATILADLVSKSYITTIKGYTLCELLGDNSNRQGIYAYNASTKSAVAIDDYLSLSLETFVEATTETASATTKMSKDSYSYQGITSGSAVFNSSTLAVYGTYSIKPKTSSSVADGVTTIADAYYMVSYTVSLQAVTDSGAYSFKIASTPGTHYDGTPEGF